MKSVFFMSSLGGILFLAISSASASTLEMHPGELLPPDISGLGKDFNTKYVAVESSKKATEEEVFNIDLELNSLKKQLLGIERKKIEHRSNWVQTSTNLISFVSPTISKFGISAHFKGEKLDSSESIELSFNTEDALFGEIRRRCLQDTSPEEFTPEAFGIFRKEFTEKYQSYTSATQSYKASQEKFDSTKTKIVTLEEELRKLNAKLDNLKIEQNGMLDQFASSLKAREKTS
ncbi:MAG: hypothetical protein LBI26_00840 [Holosporales bacterium]|jgi:peptidoglycan hydrolase CwlO-like protein|nr:hypothetical protein [Holosporales bacterium]